MTLILGKPIATAKQMSTYLLSVNKTPKFSRNISALDFCQLFLDICAKEGVRGDIAFAQSCKETANFKYGGDVKYTQNNFAGIGATGGGVCGCIFSSIEEGILAQAQHLKTYATKDALNEICVDPRRTNWFVNTKGGISPHIETLGGTWAVPGYDTKKYSSLESANTAKDSYGYQIIDILNKILKIKNKEVLNMAYTNSPLVSYTKLSPNHSGQRTHTIDTITIHCYVGQVSVESAGNAFANPNKQASCNYVIGTDGRIGLIVEEKNRSWCSSNAANDQRAVTIECASATIYPYTVNDKVFSSLIELCTDICKRNGIKKLVWSTNKNERVNHLNGCNMTVHRDYKNKTCPGKYLYDRHSQIADEVNKRLGVKLETTTPTTSSANTYVVQKGDTLSKIGVKTGVAWKTIASLNGIKFPYTVRIGQVLKLKNTTPTSAPTTPVTGNYDLIFNATYYANKYPDLKSAFGTNATQLLNHFKTYGMKEGRQAISTFNVKVYKENNADLLKAFGNAGYEKYFEHYMTYGHKEKRKCV